MKTSQDLARLGARTKLFKRHLQEWKTLLETQKTIRHSVQGLVSRQLSLNEGNPPTTLILDITQRAIRLQLLNASHSSERQQLKTRHQQEDTALEKVFNEHKNGAVLS